MTRVFGYIAIMFLFAGCNLFFEEPPPSIEDPRIVNTANERLQRYIDQKQESCYNRINLDAEIHIDSTITNLIDRYLMEGVKFPPKPTRPGLPSKLEIDTSFLPTPIFKDSLKFSPRERRDTAIQMPDTLSIING